MPRIQPGSAFPRQVAAARPHPPSAARHSALLACGAALAAALQFGAAPAAAWIEADPAVERTRAFLEDGPAELLPAEERARLKALPLAERIGEVAARLARDPLPETPENELAVGIENRRRRRARGGFFLLRRPREAALPAGRAGRAGGRRMLRDLPPARGLDLRGRPRGPLRRPLPATGRGAFPGLVPDRLEAAPLQRGDGVLPRAVRGAARPHPRQTARPPAVQTDRTDRQGHRGRGAVRVPEGADDRRRGRRALRAPRRPRRVGAAGGGRRRRRPGGAGGRAGRLLLPGAPRPAHPDPHPDRAAGRRPARRRRRAGGQPRDPYRRCRPDRAGERGVRGVPQPLRAAAAERGRAGGARALSRAAPQAAFRPPPRAARRGHRPDRVGGARPRGAGGAEAGAGGCAAGGRGRAGSRPHSTRRARHAGAVAPGRRRRVRTLPRRGPGRRRRASARCSSSWTASRSSPAARRRGARSCGCPTSRPRRWCAPRATTPPASCSPPTRSCSTSRRARRGSSCSRRRAASG